MTMTDTRDTYCADCTHSYMKCVLSGWTGTGLCCERCSHDLTDEERLSPVSANKLVWGIDPRRDSTDDKEIRP